MRRNSSPITEVIYKRAADLLKLPDALLDEASNAERLQLVHYNPDEKYDAHHDWGVEDGAPSRHITLLLYLNDPVAGGQSAFPKVTDETTGKPLEIHPGSGAGILFYNLLEDGNADDRALHAALPVVAGEKWLANFWVWDPIKAAGVDESA